MNSIKPGLYRHYKGKDYEIIGIARHSETLEEFAVYKALYQTEGQNLWIRPIQMFSDMVKVEGVEQPRFRFLG